MTDHIQLWKIPKNKPVFPSISRSTIHVTFCQNPNFDNEMNFTSIYYIYFWRTDRDLVNCFRCLAILREMELKNYG